MNVRGNDFFEGVWCGEYGSFEFDRCANVFGSGGKINDNAAVFVPPSHTLEPLYIYRDSGHVMVSNSLPMLFSRATFQFEPHNWTYGSLFCSIVSGLDETPKDIPVSRGRLSIVYHHNFEIRACELAVLHPKPLPPSLGSYDSYRDYLIGAIRGAAANASHRYRRARYRLLTTVSSGYDSAACAALAAITGCRESISIRSARGGGNDSGGPIARALGLEVTEYTRIERASGSEIPEAEFLAAGMQGEDFAFKVFESRLPQRLLLTGFHGDKVWERMIAPSTTIKRGDVSGCSLGEFRLRTDFVHLPVPFIGCQRHPDIQAISNSPEMKAFSVRDTYDRPIARRIVEEAGVARSLFGQEKRATTLQFFFEESLLSPSTLVDIRQFRSATVASLSSRVSYLSMALRWWLGVLFVSVYRRLRTRSSRRKSSTAYVSRQNVFSRIFGQKFPIFEHSHPQNTIWVRWAVSKVSHRYRSKSETS